MASTMASTTALLRPSEKLGTHSTRVDITGEDSGQPSTGATLDGKPRSVQRTAGLSDFCFQRVLRPKDIPDRGLKTRQRSGTISGEAGAMHDGQRLRLELRQLSQVPGRERGKGHVVSK